VADSLKFSSEGGAIPRTRLIWKLKGVTYESSRLVCLRHYLL
jgi:hypothetical protein